MANRHESTQLVARGMVAAFKYEATFTATATNVNKYLGKADPDVARSGRSIDIKIPNRANGDGSSGNDETLDLQDIQIETAPFALNSFSKAHYGVTLVEGAVDLDDLTEDVISPSKEKIVTGKEEEHSQVITQIGNCVLADSLGASVDDVGLMNARLNGLGVPKNMRQFLSDSYIQESIVNGSSTFFNPSKEVERGWYKGEIQKARNFPFMTSELLPVHTNGTAAGGTFDSDTGLTKLGEVSAVPAENSNTLAVDTITTDGTITAGTSIEIDGVSAVKTSGLRTTTGIRFQAAVATTVTSAAGAVTLTIKDKFNSGTDSSNDSWKNINALPAIDADVFIVGEPSAQYRVGIGYHKNAFMVGFAEMAKPEGTKHTRFSEYGGKTGIKGICIYKYSENSNKNIYRTDSYSGAAILRPEFGVKLYQKIAS